MSDNNLKLPFLLLSQPCLYHICIYPSCFSVLCCLCDRQAYIPAVKDILLILLQKVAKVLQTNIALELVKTPQKSIPYVCKDMILKGVTFKFSRFLRSWFVLFYLFFLFVLHWSPSHRNLVVFSYYKNKRVSTFFPWLLTNKHL